MSVASRRRRDSEASRPSRPAAIAYSLSPPSLPDFDEGPVLPLLPQRQNLFTGLWTTPRTRPPGRGRIKTLGGVGRSPTANRSFRPTAFSPYRPTGASVRRSSTRHLIGYWTADSSPPTRGGVPTRIPPPRGSTICERRAERRSVLFAKKATGKGARSKRHHTTESRISCRSQR